jgi:hypothetical protein
MVISTAPVYFVCRISKKSSAAESPDASESTSDSLISSSLRAAHWPSYWEISLILSRSAESAVETFSAG